MVGRDQWFSIHATGPAETALSKTPGAATATGNGGFQVDPDAIPAVKTGFEEAIVEMNLAKRAAQDMVYLQGEGVNPVVDKYMASIIDRATGEAGSVTMAADSAIAAYQDVIDQLDAALADYRATEDANAAELPAES